VLSFTCGKANRFTTIQYCWQCCCCCCCCGTKTLNFGTLNYNSKRLNRAHGGCVNRLLYPLYRPISDSPTVFSLAGKTRLLFLPSEKSESDLFYAGVSIPHRPGRRPPLVWRIGPIYSNLWTSKFKFDLHIPRNSSDMIPSKCSKRGVARVTGHVSL